MGIVNAEPMFVKMYKSFFYRAPLCLRIQTLAVACLLFFVLVSANAATWYVDNTAAGANNGTSWANAWTSLSSASGSSVAAGDTVYISGGASGSSQTYSMSGSWAPKSGASGNRITYQIGQDSLHNGTAIISGSGVFLTAPSNVNLIGDAGDGKLHLASSGYNGITSGSFSNLRIGYINFGTMTGNINSACMYAGTVNGFEFDHNYIYQSSTTADAILHVDGFGGTAYDQNLIHDNEMYTPGKGSGIGADGMVFSGVGFSIYNNTVINYRVPAYSAGQHSDGWQTSGGSYIKIYNNFIFGFSDIGLYGGCWGNAVAGGSHTFAHYRCYNNIVDSGDMNAAGCIDVSADDGTSSTFTDCLVMNNICRQQPGNGAQCFSFATGAGPGTWTLNGCSNNICIGGGVDVHGGATFPNGNNSTITDVQAATLFASFVAGRTTNNNFHLSATATSLIGKAANFYAIFTTDKDGNPRPSSGAWDMGPYNYGASVANTNPTIQVLPANLDFGTVLTSLSTNLTLTVQNIGGGTLTGSASVTAPFQIISGGTYNLGSNQTQTVTVKFNPTAAGTYNQAINFTGGNGASANLTGVAYAVLPGLSFNADSGILLAPFTVTASGLVPSGSYVSQASTTGLAGSGEAVYAFNITSAGSYAISILVNAPNSAANSFYVNIDGQPTDPTMIWDPPVTSGFTNLVVSWRGTGTDTNNQFAPIVFNLSTGTHQLVVRGREGGGQLASISIIPYAVPPAPTGLHVLSP